MAKTIDQLAEEYAKSTLVGSPSVKKNAYKAGANAVLDEIKALLPVSQIHSYHEVYDDIVGLVKQLKGEQQ